MVGIYALPPILRHYYGEKVIAPGEVYSGDGKVIRLLEVRSFERADVGLAFLVADIVVTAEADWELKAAHFSLELDGVDDWVGAVAAGEEASSTVSVPAGVETSVSLLFPARVSEGEAPTVEALHLSEPRVKFEVAR
jgi:hypothetical protein